MEKREPTTSLGWYDGRAYHGSVRTNGNGRTAVSHFRYAGENVLVTGGAGAIGGHLVRRLEEGSAKATVLDDSSSGEKDNLCGTSATFVRGSVTDSRALDEVFADAIHAVDHLAALL